MTKQSDTNSSQKNTACANSATAGGTGGFTAMPSIAREIVELTQNPGTTAAQLGGVIGADERLKNRILKLANSPLFGLPQRVSTVNFAVVVLGFDTLRTLVTRLMIGDAVRKIVDSLFNYEEFWDESVRCAAIARVIARKTGRADMHHALVAGLLHNVGYLVFHESIKEHRTALEEIQRRSNLPFGQVMEIFCGMQHEAAGAGLVERWLLPTEIVEAVRFHTNPDRATENPALTAIVHVSECVARRLRSEDPRRKEPLGLAPGVCATLGLSEAELRSLFISEYAEPLTTALNGVPDFETIIRTTKQELIDALGDLPEREKLIVALYYYENLSFLDIASVLGMDEAAVVNLHQGAMERLQTIIESRI
jgi:RNA polymerase sigma factor (sigma-70 family)